MREETFGRSTKDSEADTGASAAKWQIVPPSTHCQDPDVPQSYEWLVRALIARFLQRS